MALTATQQLEMMSGTLKPPSTDLTTLVHQTAYIAAKNWYDDVKDTSGNTEATSYANKMYGVAKRVLRNEQGIIGVLTRMVATIIGDSAYTYAQVSGATQTQWEGFVLDQMDEAFEYLGDVRQAEITAYDAI